MTKQSCNRRNYHFSRLEVVNFSGCQTLTDEAINGLLVKHGI